MPENPEKSYFFENSFISKPKTDMVNVKTKNLTKKNINGFQNITGNFKNLGIFGALMSAQLNLRTHSDYKTRQLSENLKIVNKRLDVNKSRGMSTRTYNLHFLLKKAFIFLFF